ncbi:hypothetical protein D6201_05330 [Aurantiacibacter aquimixticola]|uniref:DUF4019 domain-containing protein n=2 Tax=Aurantiacibacter aquimixticola TaxID=1958945 RepID=A0A419RSU3_9SPHN|nr:hypothetical protein D6201_05330 [Aurantiacibacter aquimixticola]
MVALVVNANAYAATPEGKAAAAQRDAKDAAQKLDEQLDEAQVAAAEKVAIESGEHCLSGWDGSHNDLERAVRTRLRNPRSFEHIETVRSPVDAEGKFALIMTYRAENGFGGINIEAIGVEVDVATCHFREVSNDEIAARLAP